MQYSQTKAGLVLEGGGLRGIFSAGILRRFVDEGLSFTSLYGVSMGACNGVNFTSRQHERNRIVSIKYVNDPRYLSFLRLLKGGDLFGMDFIFREIPYHLSPFDYEAFHNNPTKFWIGVTDCNSGNAVYFEKKQFGNIDECCAILKASASLPLISKPVSFNNSTYMDGGIADPIPIRKCMDEGEKKRVILLTQPAGYQKKASKGELLCRMRYPHFKEMNKILSYRHEVYNDTLSMIENMEQRGEAFVIRPETTLGVGRVCRNQKKLYQLYDEGYFAAQRKADALREYLAI